MAAKIPSKESSSPPFSRSLQGSLQELKFIPTVGMLKAQGFYLCCQSFAELTRPRSFYLVCSVFAVHLDADILINSTREDLCSTFLNKYHEKKAR